MRLLITIFCLGGLLMSAAVSADDKDKKAKDIPMSLSFKMKSLSGKDVHLGKYKGKVILVVNVASECGLTPQYEQLQAIHEKYSKKGLAVLGFPCNQFGSQEPGSSAEITKFCKTNYGVKFDMFEKVDVNGGSACDLYKYLTKVKTKPKGSGKVAWNFEKFLINRKGEVIARFEPRTSPDDKAVVAMIEKELNAK